MRPSGSGIGIAGLRLLGLLQLAALCQPLLGQGVIATIAGGSKIFPVGSLPALTTAVAPVGVVVAPNGDVYFSDQPSNTVLKLSAQGQIAIVAGNGINGFSGDGAQATQASLSL